EKAMDLIAEASSRVRLRRAATPPSLKEAMKGLESLRREKEQAITAQQYEYAAELRDRELKLQEKIKEMGEWEEGEEGIATPVVTEEDVSEVISMWTGIPVSRIASEESARLLRMEEQLRGRIIGQDEAIETI